MGGLAKLGTTNDDPVGFLAGVGLSKTQRERLCGNLGDPTSATQPDGDKLTISSARKSWHGRRFRRFALDAARTNDRAAMTVGAAVSASLRLHDPEGFAAGLTAAQTYPLAFGRSTGLARRANAVLTAAYAIAAADTRGLDLGAVHWASAPPGWRIAAAPWVYANLDATNGRAVGDLLDAVHSRGLRFIQPGISPFNFTDSTSEFEDVRLRLQTGASRLTKWFDRPMWFDGGAGQVQVLLTQDEDRYMYEWVGVDGVGVLVAFDLVDLLPYGQDVLGVRAALTLALGWYLDVSISLRSSTAGSQTLQRKTTGTTTSGARYVPTPSFMHQVQQVTQGSQIPPRPHGVVLT